MRQALVALLLIGLTASFRFLALTGFPDDHYVHLAGAQQMLHGAWPSRDFVDLGAPLTYGMSAAVQRVFGESQLTEAVFMALSFGAAAALTWRAGVALTGSALLALIPVLIEVLIFPRTYSYPKVVIYSAAALAMLWYAERPSPVRVIALATLAVVAGLIRHDHGMYVGLASLVAVVLSPVPSDRFKGAASAALYCGTAVVLVLPYLIYLQSTEGVLGHVQRGVAFAALEMSRQRLPLWDLRSHEVWLLLLIWFTPLASIAAIAARRIRREPDAWRNVQRVTPLIALTLIVNTGLIRDLPETRLPDAIVAPALLLAWLVRQAWSRLPAVFSVTARTATVVSVAVTMWAVSVMGHTPEQIDRIGAFNGLERLPARFAERAGEMQRPWAGRQAPSAAAQRMHAFFDYSGRCVPGDSRLLVPAFLPEVVVLARRPFAGGQIFFMPGALATPGDHALAMRRLAGERVPIAVIRRPTYDSLALEFPELDAYINGHFTPVEQWSLGGDDTIVLLADTRQSRRLDAVTGWPCFR